MRVENIIHISGADKKFIFPLIEILKNEIDGNYIHTVIIPNFRNEDKEYFLSKGIITPSIQDSKIRILKYVLSPIKTLQYFYILYREINRSNKIFIHGLFDKKLILFFTLFPKLNEKCSWLIWGGGDLNTSETFSSKPFNKFIVKVKGRFREYLTYLEEDYIDILTYYPVENGKFSYNLLYVSNTCSATLNVTKKAIEKNKIKNILIGHSADFEGDHLNVFKKMVSSRLTQHNIHCILSYGEKPQTPNYTNKIIKTGNKYFNHFNALTNLIAYEEYVEYLNTMDILVLNHRYQQAMGNIILGLFLNKVIVLNDTANHYYMLKRLGFDIISLSQFLEGTYDLNVKNTKLAESLFTYKSLVSTWKKNICENY